MHKPLHLDVEDLNKRNKGTPNMTCLYNPLERVKI